MSSSKKAIKIHNKSSAYDSDCLINYYFIQLLLITLLKINMLLIYKIFIKKISIILQYPSYMDYCFVVIINSCMYIIQNSSFVLHGQNNSTNIKWKICLIKWKRILILGAQKEICSFQYLLTVLFDIYLPLRKFWVQMWFTLYHPRSQTFQPPTSRKQNLPIQINEFKTDVYYQENWLPPENKTSVL